MEVAAEANIGEVVALVGVVELHAAQVDRGVGGVCAHRRLGVAVVAAAHVVVGLESTGRGRGPILVAPSAQQVENIDASL